MTRVRSRSIGIACVVTLVAVVVVLLVKPQHSRPERVPTFTGNAYANGDLANTRRFAGRISRSNVGRLRLAWVKELGSSFSAPPVITHGVVFSQDFRSNVRAMNLQSGKLYWEKAYNDPSNGPNGLVLGNGRVFGATSSSAFALDQRTGRQLWSARLVRNSHEGIDMAPGYHQGVVYVSTVPGNGKEFYEGQGVGTLWALDGRTGARKWKFDTVPSSLWAPAVSVINSGGGLWYPPSFDEGDGMYFGVGNPSPFPGTAGHEWGSSRPGPNLYSDSLVKLDTGTGKVRWHYQVTPHDLYDWDLQDPPILTRVRGKDAVITAGKAGIVIAVDRDSGRLLWKRAVGRHNGHDKDSLYAMRGEYDKLKALVPVYPGILGGVIAPMATDGSTLFVPVTNQSTKYSSTTYPEYGKTASGEFLGLDLNTGAIRWRKHVAAQAYGAMTVVNDLVLSTTFDGTVYAFDTHTGDIAWRSQLPSEPGQSPATNTGVAVSGDTIITSGAKQVGDRTVPVMAAYRLK